MADHPRQYIAVQFAPWDRKTYTYHNDREPVAIGDSVVVSTARGPATVEVVAIVDKPTGFETKPIVGKEREGLA